MSPRPSHAYHHGDLRRALLDASLALVQAKGVSALSLREVARRASVSHAAPYHHFADKAALMQAIRAEGFELLHAQMAGEQAEARRGAGDAPGERLAAAGRGYVRFALGHPGHFRVMFRPEMGASRATSAGGKRAYELLRDAVIACEKARLAPAGQHGVLVLAAWSLVHGFASLWLDGPLSVQEGAPAPEVAAAEITTLLVRLYASAGGQRLAPTAARKSGRPEGRSGQRAEVTSKRSGV